jgi:hypothetical protein
VLEKLIIQKTLRVPASTGAAGDGTPVARQLDVALLDVGFSASRALLEHIGALAPAPAMDLAAVVVSAVRELVGDHVQHNAYFIGFPDDVPDTAEFWTERLRAAVVTGGDTVTDVQLRDAVASGAVNLLDLPAYGTYQHTYAELLAAHDELITAAGDRVTLLRLGDAVDVEATRLYLALAGSSTPLGEADLAILSELAVACVHGAQPAEMPVRENRAVLNGIRLVLGRPLVAVDTTTDVLRLACQVSGGDASLVTPTRFRAFRRPERRVLLAALNDIVGANPGKLGDVARYAERWKRLGERLHPHEYDQWPHARAVFEVARGERRVRNLAGRAEAAIRAGAISSATSVLSAAPGLLLRSADRLLRLASEEPERTAVVDAVAGALGSASGRVLLSLREHVDNRLTPASARMYASRSRSAWIGPDERPPLPAELVAELSSLLDTEVSARLPQQDRPLLVDPAVLDVALPLSGKAAEGGFAILPRGSRAPVSGDLLRFFMYWRQARRSTDYDLSVLLVDDEFHSAGQVSWTNYHHNGLVHSGDITDAPNGATEFIDMPMTTGAHYVVPQVFIYAGESFDEVAESMFGYQTRTQDQLGAPFDARTVRARSHLRGQGRIALPMVFARSEVGWQAVWLHLYSRGRPSFNRVEDNTFTTADRVRALMERRYLTVAYLIDRWRARTEVMTWDGRLPDGPVTFIGIQAPEDLPDGSEVYTLDRLSELIPE